MQAIITTVTPSLENGNSIIAGGFNQILLSKLEPIVFKETDIGFRRVINRSITGGLRPKTDKETINKVPILPKLVLLKHIGKFKESDIL